MKRTDLADEFARLQRESQRAVEALGNAMAELGPKRTDHRRPPRFALVVQEQPVIAYLSKT